YRQTLQKVIKNPRRGRAARLTHLQKDFKHAWERLEKVPIRGTYQTSVSRWTCDCGAQKYHAHLLCKHLVQAVGHPSAAWWPTVIRYHVPPFYTIPGDNGVVPAPPENVAGHGWAARLHQKRSAIIRRPVQVDREAHEASDASSSGPGMPLSDGVMSTSSVRVLPQAEVYSNIYCQICSSPDKASHTGPDGILREHAGGGAGFPLDDEEHVAVDEVTVQRRLTSAIDILQSQGDNPDARFFKTATKCIYGTIRWVCKVDQQSLPECDAVHPDSLVPFLRRALVLFQELRQSGDGGTAKAIENLRGTTDWARALELAESRRTMPRTNVHRRGAPNPTYMYGYRYREEASELLQ
ncbi:hypothetical protein FKP32DRAFT_1562866, partial [Trametes sanguinea]